ncbi:hypothetical protein G7Z17_g13333 [Cylindrodendrum hubeiense]|uniref:Peptidyl-tRNA hydrolase n=1 Tax=Cylindrodendrum hubeiense TaxID=595255 RepID=A0A9P5H064_9HYPO|nr:hypothetical protein G7Z17_g13333 [Cylindrodendrum hubeiense]
MRFSSSALVAALPALAAAQDSPIDQYKAQFQDFLGQMSSYIPNPGAHDPVAAHEAKTGALKLSTLTLNNWQETLYEPVGPDDYLSRGVVGRCDKVEAAFKETAAKFALLEQAPHMGYLNCDDQPILCNAWSTGTSNLYVFEMLPSPAPIDIYKKRLNMTTTTSEDLVNLFETGSKDEFKLLEAGWFHPFQGKAVEFGIAVPFGYVMWAFGLIPNWMFMLVVSFVSRTMMGNRVQGQANRDAGRAQ